MKNIFSKENLGLGEKEGLTIKEQDRLKILWLFCAQIIIVTPFYIYGYWKLGAPGASIPVVIIVPLIVLTYVVWRVFRSPVVAGNWIVALGFTLFFISSSYTGGIDGPALTWSIAVPLIAVLICGYRSGIFWLVLVLAKISYFYWAGRMGHAFTQQYPSQANLEAAYYISVIGIAIFTFLLSLISEYFKNHYLKIVEKSNEELKEALESIKTLKGLIPICAWCKKIRNDKGYWDHLETYIKARSEAQFSHGICPDCEIKEINKFHKEQGS